MAELGGRSVALRMDEDEDAERLRLGPERVERRVRDFHARDVPADSDTAEPKLANRVLDLIGSEIRKLQRRRRKGDEPVGIAGARLRQPLVLDLDQLRREIAILERFLPPAASAEAIAEAVAAAIAETGAGSAKDFGKVMKAAMGKLAGASVDGKLVSEAVKARLG